MSRVVGYGVCAKCRQTLHLVRNEWIHATPDITHEAVIKSPNTDWIDQ